MELSLLPLILLLSNMHPGQTQERAKPEVIIEHYDPETVTVRCEIPGTEDDWTYSWFIEGLSHSFSSDRELILKTDVSDSSNITCRGERKSDGQKSEISDAVMLLYFLIEAPKPLLTVQPEPSQIFRGETVTLNCDIQGEVWTYIWQCGDEQDNSEEKELKITVESEQKCRCYGCKQSFCSQWSDNVTLAVSERPKPRLTVQPEPSQIFRGQTVTLTCDIQETDVSSWSYSWKKDDSLIHVSQSQEYRISSVNESQTGNYSCTGRETRGSRYSHTSDKVTLAISGSKAPLPVLKLLSFLLAASPYLLVTIILGVKCYRAYVQTDEINQYTFTEE